MIERKVAQLPDLSNPPAAPVADPPGSDDPWQQAWCRLYDTPNALVPLGTIMHWRSVAGGLGVVTSLDHDTALVSRGYFYRPHTPPPDAVDLEADRRAAAAAEAEWLLYPVIRTGDTGALGASGHPGLPWFVEAEFVPTGDIDRDLRTVLGGTRFRDLRRLVRRSDEHFVWEVTRGEQIDDGTLVEFDRLHQLNLAKYGHRHNHFALPILRGLAASGLRERLCVFGHRTRTGIPVQAALAVHYPESATLEILVHGIDHAAVPSSQNLYAATMYRIYRWGQAHGIGRFNLGRGAERVKLDLGANRFHVVANYLVPASGATTPDPVVDRLAAAARTATTRSVHTLNTVVARRGLGGVVTTPRSPG
ncbi:GNAT family N-acetyltransferase [Nocardia sp. NPDC019395]|uniref:GNAT family N-acetyltransferase n=1 Tax=Nocardia sp. NPDC019395 TaxID=3154686 RepID=UPI0033F76474